MLASNSLNALVAEHAPQIARDPRPTPTLRVGAMGHRTLPPGAEPRVTAAVERVLAAIRVSALAAVADPGPALDQELLPLAVRLQVDRFRCCPPTVTIASWP